MRFLSLLFVFLLVFLSACEDEPTAVGAGLIPQGDLIVTDTLDSSNSGIIQKSNSFVSDELDFTSASRDLVGKYRDSYTELEAVLAMGLDIAMDTADYKFLKDSTLEVISAKFILKPDYEFGSEDAIFDFNVHPLIKNWDLASGIKNDDLDTLYDNSVNLKVSPLAHNNDSLYTFDVNTSVMKEWIYKSILDSNYDYYTGVLFDPSSTTNKFLGFATSDVASRPQIMVEITKGEENISDTLTFQTASALEIQHVFTERVLAEDNKNLLVQGGVPFRSFLHFDLSSIPEDALLNRAELVLTIDSSKSVNTSDALTTLFVDPLEDSTDLNSISETIAYSALSKSGDTFKGSVTSTLQGQLIENLNEGYVISAYNEPSTVSRDVFYSSDSPDISKRPRLIIYYTKKN